MKVTKKELYFIKKSFKTKDIIKYLFAKNLNLDMICITDGLNGSLISQRNGQEDKITTHIIPK